MAHNLGRELGRFISHKDEESRRVEYEKARIFKFIQEEIHTTVFATTDKKGRPVTCVIDIMLADEEKLYFITAKGKSLYQRLMDTNYVAFSGIVGEDTLFSKSVSVRGNVKDIVNHRR